VESNVVSIKETCKLVGVTRRTIYNWIVAGRVKCCRTAGGGIRIVVSSLWRPAATDIDPTASAAITVGR
jgi:excisionase family DNA binding protein